VTLYHLALVSESSQVGMDALAPVAAAIQTQVLRDFAPHWGISATVDAFARLDQVPVTYYPMIVRDDISVQAAGIHLDKDFTPYALISTSNRWSLTASHEALEMLADPFGTRLQAGDSIKPGQGTVEYLVEVCDASEAVAFSYRVNGVVVSDFYLPSFYDPVANDRVRVSFTGALSHPLEVAKGGYLSWRDPSDQHWWQQRWFDTPEPTFHDLGVITGTESPRRFLDRLVMEARPDAVEGAAPASDDHELLVAAYALAVREGYGSGAHAERLRTEIEALLLASGESRMDLISQVEELRGSLDAGA
jgi:hypothetical protein